MRRALAVSMSVLLTVATAFAQPQAGLRLPAIFADHMVLQRGIAVPVWGWADPGDQITVTFKDQKKTATADASGKWIVKLDKLDAGGPFELLVAGKTSKAFKNVLVGEVWVCSGQSNMEFSLNGAHNAKEAIAASENPMLRHFNLRKATAFEPLSDCQGAWAECNPKTAGGFTAVGYFFGLKLQKDLNVPVGLIHTSWGGTPIEPWTSAKTYGSDPELKPQVENWTRVRATYEAALKKYEDEAAAAKKEGKPAPKKPQEPRWAPGQLYNAMIAPVVPYGIAGAIWYQGESNAGNAVLYRKQMPLMIKDWRDAWGQGEFPFFIVSLANFMARQPEPVDQNWAWLREAQLMATTALPKVGVAMAIDVGDAKDIHPRDKQTVGQRLALNALAIGYGKEIVYSGPLYDSMKVEGDKIRLTFKHVGGGLTMKGEKLVGFAIAGEDKKFVWADATIDGNSVVCTSKQVAKPVAVRYGWADNPEVSLYNKEGLPAVPFRTDDWPRAAAAPRK